MATRLAFFSVITAPRKIHKGERDVNDHKDALIVSNPTIVVTRFSFFFVRVFRFDVIPMTRFLRALFFPRLNHHRSMDDRLK